MTDNLERRDLVDKANAWDAIAAKNAEITRLQEALAAAEAERDGLLDPATVRVNILHGRIAIPDDLVWLHDTSGPVAALLAETRKKALEWKERAEVAEAKLAKRRHWQTAGQSDEWYTPAYIFDALGCTFDLDVAHPADAKTHVPAREIITANSLAEEWAGYVWMNPPFGGRNSLVPWLDKFFEHGDGIALTPDRSSAPWWQEASKKAEAILFIYSKVKFLRPDGTEGGSPANGTTLFASGPKAIHALTRAAQNGLGYLATPAGRLALQEAPK